MIFKKASQEAFFLACAPLNPERDLIILSESANTPFTNPKRGFVKKSIYTLENVEGKWDNCGVDYYLLLTNKYNRYLERTNTTDNGEIEKEKLRI